MGAKCPWFFLPFSGLVLVLFGQDKSFPKSLLLFHKFYDSRFNLLPLGDQLMNSQGKKTPKFPSWEDEAHHRLKKRSSSGSPQLLIMEKRICANRSPQRLHAATKKCLLIRLHISGAFLTRQAGARCVTQQSQYFPLRNIFFIFLREKKQFIGLLYPW